MWGDSELSYIARKIERKINQSITPEAELGFTVIAWIVIIAFLGYLV